MFFRFQQNVYTFEVKFLLTWKIDNCILLWDKNEKISLETAKVEISWTPREAPTQSDIKPSHSHFPEGNFSYIPHPLSLSMPPSPLPTEMFSHKKAVFHANFYLTKKIKKFTCSQHWERRRKHSTRDINSDKIRKTKIGFVPSVINRKFWRYQTVWKAISLLGGFYCELFLVIARL